MFLMGESTQTELWYLYTMEQQWKTHYWSLQQLLRLSLNLTMVSGRSQTEKVASYMSPFLGHPGKGKMIGTKQRISGVQR